MYLFLKRNRVTGGASIGRLMVGGFFTYWTREDADDALKAGIYPVVITPAQGTGHLLPLVTEVPEHDRGVRMKSLADGTDGPCILLGLEHTVSKIDDSVFAMQGVQSEIAGALARGEDVWLEVIDATVRPASCDPS